MHYLIIFKQTDLFISWLYKSIPLALITLIRSLLLDIELMLDVDVKIDAAESSAFNSHSDEYNNCTYQDNSAIYPMIVSIMHSGYISSS